MCSRAIITELGRSWNGVDALPPFAHELMQQSVDSEEMYQANATARIEMLHDAMDRDGTTWADAESIDWYALGGTFFFTLVGRNPSAKMVGHGAKVAEYFYTLFPISDYPEAEKAKDSITQSLLLVDGLLAADRKQRVNLDISDKEVQPVKSWKSNKNGGYLRASMLQVDEDVIDREDLGTTCSAFIQTAASKSDILKELQVTSASTPEFLQTLSC